MGGVRASTAGAVVFHTLVSKGRVFLLAHRCAALYLGLLASHKHPRSGVFGFFVVGYSLGYARAGLYQVQLPSLFVKKGGGERCCRC